MKRKKMGETERRYRALKRAKKYGLTGACKTTHEAHVRVVQERGADSLAALLKDKPQDA